MISHNGPAPAADWFSRDSRGSRVSHHGTAAGAALLCFVFFYFHRSQTYAGDGALLARIIEGGRWLVQNELLSQAFLELLFQLASPWQRTALEIMNLVSCAGGALSVWILLRFARRLYHLPAQYPLLLFFSSGFLVYSCGHTEYYPLVLPALLGYGYSGVAYLRRNAPLTPACVIFVLGCGLHFVTLLALPSLLLLPWLSRRKQDYSSILIWSMLLIPLFLIRVYPQILGHQAAGLSPAWNVLPLFPYPGMYRWYAFFQWSHWLDWLYAWSMRSWLFLPLTAWLVWRQGVRSLRLPERQFLVVFLLAFTAWTTVWHPDLGVEADWDLFALEAAPGLLLLLSYWPDGPRQRFVHAVVMLAAVASVAVTYSRVLAQAAFPRLGYGAARIDTPHPGATVFTMDGLNQPLHRGRVREGIYWCKWVDSEVRAAGDFWLVVTAGETTAARLDKPLRGEGWLSVSDR
ncbi:MAG TPA: hypothetical protein PLH79_14415 [bacterium]|nr:hypothetical protein [bacterium]HPP02321.1 hypothetical protein [bacterium]